MSETFPSLLAYFMGKADKVIRSGGFEDAFFY